MLGRDEIGVEDAAETLHILLKYQTDIERATKDKVAAVISAAKSAVSSPADAQ